MTATYERTETAIKVHIHDMSLQDVADGITLAIPRESVMDICEQWKTNEPRANPTTTGNGLYEKKGTLDRLYQPCHITAQRNDNRPNITPNGM